ncbi:MAG: pyruvate carboxyltransferase [Chloroflexi bacterium]|nr:pyruvate carboxyltransferase [Chloroflexota bacterium]MBI3763804.1 pyruvate carboxyltransferase [Chloroflexota bacterium]
MSRFAQYQPRPLEIIDTTLREGQQTSLLHDHHKYFFTRADKEEILRALIVYGVKFVEVFAPVVGPQERDDFDALKAARDSLVTQKGYTFLLAHVRCRPTDVASAIEAGADGLNFYIGTSLESRAFNHGNDLNTLSATARRLIDDVRRSHPGLILRFSGEDAFRTRESDLFRVYDEIVPLVDRLGLPDTVGVAAPAAVARRVAVLRARYPNVELEGHFHDDRGFALVNALEAIRSGVRYINTTVLGIGERSGITSLSALLFNLYVDRDFDRLEGYHLRGSYPLNVLVADKLKKLVPSKEPVSLTNRTHTAGVHQSAVLREASVYEAHPLDVFGVSESEILLGPLSGWNVIHYFLKEIRYYQLDETTAKEITAAFKERAYRLGPEVSPEQVLIEIAEREFGLARLQLPEAALSQIVQRLDSSASGDASRVTGVASLATRHPSRVA